MGLKDREANQLDDSSKLRLNNHVLNYSAYVIALGGFLFGYDTGVINGALAFMSLPDQLNLSPGAQGMVSSALILGGCIGALSIGTLADKYGRQRALRWIAIIFTLSTIGCAFSVHMSILISFRFLLGLAVGAASSLSPMYLAEISPASLQVKNINRNAISIVLGQLIAFIVNAILGNIFGSWHAVWRLMIMAAAVPAILLWIGSFTIPNSPKWESLKGHVKKARDILLSLGFTKQSIARAKQRQVNQDQPLISWQKILRQSALKYLLVIGVLLAVIQQISGVNTVMYYGTVILEKVGMTRGTSLYSNILVGVTSLIASIVGTRLLATHNHRRMLITGLMGNVIFMSLLSLTMQLHFFSQSVTNVLVVLWMTLFLASHQGVVSPGTWLMLAELFPIQVEARFMSVATAVLWLTNFGISFIFPILISSFGASIVFLIFALSNLLSVCLSLFFIKPKAIHAARNFD